MWGAWLFSECTTGESVNYLSMVWHGQKNVKAFRVWRLIKVKVQANIWFVNFQIHVNYTTDEKKFEIWQLIRSVRYFLMWNRYQKNQEAWGKMHISTIVQYKNWLILIWLRWFIKLSDMVELACDISPRLGLKSRQILNF